MEIENGGISMKLTMNEFMNKVTETYFASNYKVVEAIRVTKKNLNISDQQIREWFGRDISEEMLSNSKVSKFKS